MSDGESTTRASRALCRRARSRNHHHARAAISTRAVPSSASREVEAQRHYFSWSKSKRGFLRWMVGVPWSPGLHLRLWSSRVGDMMRYGAARSWPAFKTEPLEPASRGVGGSTWERGSARRRAWSIAVLDGEADAVRSSPNGAGAIELSYTTRGPTPVNAARRWRQVTRRRHRRAVPATPPTPHHERIAAAILQIRVSISARARGRRMAAKWSVGSCCCRPPTRCVADEDLVRGSATFSSGSRTSRRGSDQRRRRLPDRAPPDVQRNLERYRTSLSP